MDQQLRRLDAALLATARRLPALLHLPFHRERELIVTAPPQHTVSHTALPASFPESLRQASGRQRETARSVCETHLAWSGSASSFENRREMLPRRPFVAPLTSYGEVSRLLSCVIPLVRLTCRPVGSVSSCSHSQKRSLARTQHFRTCLTRLL